MIWRKFSVKNSLFLDKQTNKYTTTTKKGQQHLKYKIIHFSTS